jgi:hypothetical protein
VQAWKLFRPLLTGGDRLDRSLASSLNAVQPIASCCASPQQLALCVTSSSENLMQEKFDNLHKFIANNYDLENLEAKLKEFNPFKVLKVDQYEIRHSNIISWLLNPGENHNLGDTFIKKFLAEVIINNENIETDFTVFKAQDISYHDFEIRREWNDIDIHM